MSCTDRARKISCTFKENSMSDCILMTGASGGVAQALAARLRVRGYRLALVGRDAARIAAETDDTVIVADVSTAQGAEDAVAEATRALGQPPTTLAHCVGSTLIAPIARTSETAWRSLMAANLDSAFFTLKAWLGALAEARQPGAAVLFSSVAAGTGTPNHAAIAAAKAGVEALVRSLAADVSGQRIRLNAIAPGLLRTPMTTRLVGNERSAQQAGAQYPLGRFGEADEAAALAEFLLSDQASWITGQTLKLDGGFSAVRPVVRLPS